MVCLDEVSRLTLVVRNSDRRRPKENLVEILLLI